MEEKKAFELEKGSLAQIIIKANDVLTLNIGGEKTIQVSRAVLTKVKGSKLEAMFSGRHPVEMFDGKYFIDRDLEGFMLVVDFLRNDENFVLLKDEIQHHKLNRELKFWGLIDLVKRKIVLDE